MPPPVQLELVMVELAVLENAHVLASVGFRPRRTPFITSVAATVKSKTLRGRPGPRPRLITGLRGATAAGLRFQEGRNVPDLVSDRGSVDSPERAADVQSSFVLQHFHAAPADGGVDVLIDPRPRDRRHLRQIDRPGTLLISQQLLIVTLQHQSERQAMPNLDIDDAITNRLN